MLAIVLNSPAMAEERGGAAPHSHIHAPGEIDEDHAAILLEATYSFDVMANVSGGVRQGVRYLDNLDLVAEFDLDGLLGWDGAQAHIYGLYNNGTEFSALVGDAQVASNIEAGVQALRLYEAWLQQDIGSVGSVRVGLYDLNSEFDALDTAGLFIGSAHGIGTDIAQTGRNGPSIFPATSLAARVEIRPAGKWRARFAILDGVPGNPDRPKRTAVNLGNGDGALLIGEIEAPLPSGKLLLGHWRYTAREPLFDGGGTARGNDGLYLRGEMRLADTANDPVRGLDGFFRIGAADSQFNVFSTFASAGVNFSGPVAGRSDDRLGLAVAAAFTSDRYRLATGSSDAEIAFELTYRARLSHWISVQPNMQFIVNPAADPNVSDALIFGIRAEISTRLFDR